MKNKKNVKFYFFYKRNISVFFKNKKKIDKIK